MHQLLKKSGVFVEDGELYTISFKQVSVIKAEHIAAAKVENPLNTMSENEPLALYKEFR